MATIKGYVTNLWNMQVKVSQAMGCDLQYASLETRVLLLSVNIGIALVLQALTSGSTPVTTDAALQSQVNAILGLGWLPQAQQLIDPNNPNPPLSL